MYLWLTSLPCFSLLLVRLTGPRGAFRDGITDSTRRARARCVIRLGCRRSHHVSAPVQPFSWQPKAAKLASNLHMTLTLLQISVFRSSTVPQKRSLRGHSRQEWIKQLSIHQFSSQFQRPQSSSFVLVPPAITDQLKLIVMFETCVLKSRKSRRKRTIRTEWRTSPHNRRRTRTSALI